MPDTSIGKYRRGTGTNVSFPTIPTLTSQPRRIDLYQKQYNHDILTLEFPTESTSWFESMNTGVPVQMSWKQDTLDKNWIGYVASISKTNSPQRMNSMVVMCVGATFVLKEKVTRVFVNTTIPNAIKTIVESYGFKFAGEAHPQVFPQLIIPGVSYWEWIAEQAKRIGYGIIVDGMDFIMRPIDKLIDMGFSNAAVLAMGNSNIPFNTQYLDRTLDQFKITRGDFVEESQNLRAIKNVGGVDPITGDIILSSSDPSTAGTNLRTSTSDVLFQEYRTDRVVNSAVDGISAATGAAQLSRFGIPASANGQGDPRIRPFGTVLISGTGALTDGFWIVREVQHMFHKIGDYQVILKLATDGVGDTVDTPFRSRTTEGVGTVNLDDVITNAGIPSLFFELNSVELDGTNDIQSEDGQGFKKTPTRWRLAK